MAVVFGLHDLQAAFADADKQLRLGIRSSLRQIAEPVRAGSQRVSGPPGQPDPAGLGYQLFQAARMAGRGVR